jgi:hypothetical protein
LQYVVRLASERLPDLRYFNRPVDQHTIPIIAITHIPQGLQQTQKSPTTGIDQALVYLYFLEFRLFMSLTYICNLQLNTPGQLKIVSKITKLSKLEISE